MSPYIDLNQLLTDAAREFPDHTLYALADHAGMPGLHGQIVRADIPWRSLFEGSQEENALAVAPLLFPLSGTPNPFPPHLMRWIEEHGSYTSSIVLMASPLSLDKLLPRLAARLQAELSGEMAVMLRYFDPRVFQALLATASAQQLRDFLCVADCWWYVDRRGAVVRHTAQLMPDDLFAPPLRLAEEQEFTLLEASEVDQVQEQLKSAMPELYRTLALPTRYDFLSRHMATAARLGIVASHELALYCGLALLHGEDFASTPPWQTLLERVRQRSVGLSDAVADAGS